MRLKIENCNNIEKGDMQIVDGALNIKYAVNGTGKSTIAKAIQAFVENSQEKKDELVPFKYRDVKSDEKNPVLEGYKDIKSVAVFNETYLDEYVYRPDELIKNSFEVFIKTADYDKHIKEIEVLLQSVNKTFQVHPELDELIRLFGQFVEGFGKSKSGYSAAGAIGKGIAKGNKINNVPHGLEEYEPYLKGNSNVKWIKWQLEGKNYLDIADQCPYCCSSIEEKKDTILKVSEEYDSKNIEQLNKMLEIFEALLDYFSDETQIKIKEIMNNVTGITDVQKNYLIEIKGQVETFLGQLIALKRVGFHSLKEVEKIADELNMYKIELSYFSHLNSPLTEEKVVVINKTLDEVLQKAGKLQGEIVQQKNLIKKTIEMYNREINEFLKYAGYRYEVYIEEDASNEVNYRLMLRHIEANQNVNMVKNHLSFGERNAFALVLFMYKTLKDNPDLIVLDDPISSFDGNKKFAIINMLFRGEHSFKNRTVLLLTHEFNTVIDVIRTMPYNFSPAPNAFFLATKNGILTEKVIKKNDVLSFAEMAKRNIQSDVDTLNKLVYLRRLLDIVEPDSLAWQLLSNVFHKRENPEIHTDNGNRDMTNDEKTEATCYIRANYIPDFDYDVEYKKTQDQELLKTLYYDSKSNYEKLQIYRIIFNENHENSVVKKFVNETFHIENDYLFQLNPSEYDTIPQYIIDECDKDVMELSVLK